MGGTVDATAGAADVVVTGAGAVVVVLVVVVTLGAERVVVERADDVVDLTAVCPGDPPHPAITTSSESASTSAGGRGRICSVA